MRPDLVAVLESLPDPVVVVDERGVMLWANQTAEVTFGWDRATSIGRSGIEFVHPDDVATALVSLESVRSKPVGSVVEVRLRRRDGTYRLCEVRGRSLLDDPAVCGIVLSIRDLTDRRRWEVAGGDAAAVQTIVQHQSVISLLTDGDGKIRSASAALLRGLGHSLESMQGRSLLDLVHEADRHRVVGALHAARGGGSHVFEAQLVACDGRALTYQLTIVGLEDDPVVAGLIVTAQDVTALADARERLRHLATHDPLTGLANRNLLYEGLATRLACGAVGLIYVDLNEFKSVNDCFGHIVGDAALVELAQRLMATADCSDLVARIGGDEFVIATSPERVAARAKDVADAVATPLELASGKVSMSASIGTATAERGEQPDRLVARADGAMYRAKRTADHRTRSDCETGG